MIMAAFLGSARQWDLFGRRIRALQRRDGFTVFHAKDFRALRGEFEGWGPEKCVRLLNDLAVAIRDNLTEGVTIALPRALYESEYRAPPVPKGMPLDSQYGVCFRTCLYRLIQIVTADRKKHKLHVVIENGHKNVRDTCRIFREIKQEFAELGVHILGDIVIAEKSERLELMVADFQAHASYLSEKRLKVGQPGYCEMVNLRRDGAPKRGEAALTQIEFTPKSLRAIKTNWEAEKQARIEKWRAARDAKRRQPYSEANNPSPDHVAFSHIEGGRVVPHSCSPLPARATTNIMTSRPTLALIYSPDRCAWCARPGGNHWMAFVGLPLSRCTPLSLSDVAFDCGDLLELLQEKAAKHAARLSPRSGTRALRFTAGRRGELPLSR